MGEKQPCRHRGQGRRRAGGAPGALMGTGRNTSPRAAKEESMVQHWMRSGGDTADGESPQEQPWADAAALE